MSQFVLSTESVADVSKEYMKRRNLKYVCFHYMLDDEEFIDDLGSPLPYDEFYERLRQGANPRTAQVNISEYLDYFSAICEEGNDIVHVCLSSGLSSTFNSATKAAEIAKERFPERRIFIIDSLNARTSANIFLIYCVAEILGSIDSLACSLVDAIIL